MSIPPILLPKNLPSQIKVTKKAGERFARSVLREADTRFKDPSTPVDCWVDFKDVPSEDAPVSYNLLAFERKDNVWWMVVEAGTDNRVPIAGGWFRYSPGYKALVGVKAAVRKDHRRRGIYSWVLKTLRKKFHRPMVSAKELSLANAWVWSKVGVANEAIGRYKINPRPRAHRLTKKDEGLVEYVRALIDVEDLPIKGKE